MNRQQICLGLALQEAAVAVDVSTFDHRLILQKAVCILQYAGINLGYRFHWYIKGPYSTELAGDVFWMAEQPAAVKEDLDRWTLDGESKERIAKIKELFSANSIHDLARRLELLASVLFMVRTGQAKADQPQEIQRLLKLNEKEFSVIEVSTALDTLRQHGFVS